MTDILMEYGLFILKVSTVFAGIWLIVVLIYSASQRRGRSQDRLEVKNLNRRYRDMALVLKRNILPKKAAKQAVKEEKERRKLESKKTGGRQAGSRKRIFVIQFRGDIPATGVSSLREEVTAVLSVATPEDEVLLRLENAGGLVHGHGLAASQLMRIRQRNVPLTVAIDKVAASGGYMMASMGNRIIAAPFAVVGSIGVLAQLPNFHRLLQKHGIDFEQFKAGEFKRTVTMFGKNTEEERAKLRQQLEETHSLFQDLLRRYRPSLDVAAVATGEYWHGARALELKLVDELTTSDDYLMRASEGADIYDVAFVARKPFSERLVSFVDAALARLLVSILQRQHESRYFA